MATKMRVAFLLVAASMLSAPTLGVASDRRTGAGVAVGVGVLGLPDDMIGIDARITIPFSDYLGVQLRPMVLGGGPEGASGVDVGGRAELLVRSQVLMNLARVYFGVGPQAFYEASGHSAHKKDVSGGWELGLEVFVNPRASFHWEVGTSGGGVENGAGTMMSAGFQLYL